MSDKIAAPQPDKKTLELLANTIRFLSAEAVEKAKSGHPGMPMGMAELGAVLWTKYLKFNPQDPGWRARDRFVLSNGHGSMFLYSLLHLCGFDLTLEDLKHFRQFESKTPGHPESFMTEGVETTTGPLGQGVANAVGMAIAQKVMSARYAAGGFNPFDHKVVCFCGDGCLMEGVSSEASSIAGHLGLGNLILVYDDNHISIAGHTELAFTEDVCRRYEAYGWRTLRVDGHDLDAIDAVYRQAFGESDRPTIIAARTTIGKGSPNKADTHEVHGAPLGAAELEATKKALGWPLDRPFYIPDEVRTLLAARVEQLKEQYQEEQRRYAAWRADNASLAAALSDQLERKVPSDLADRLIAALPGDGKPAATRKLSHSVLQEASKAVNSLIGGSADLEPSTLTLIDGSTDIQKGEFAGLNLRFGVREHAMGSIMNGLSYYGSFIPYGSTFLCFLDYMRPAVRLAALSRLPAIFIYTHDSIFLGEDGPTHQPIEHLGMMRLTPNLHVFRPADGLETALSYAAALSRRDGPAAIVLTRQNLEQLVRPADFSNADFFKGAYAVVQAQGDPELVLVATGSEVSLAVKAAAEFSDRSVRVVSMPCRELFAAQPQSYRRKLIPAAAKVVSIEAGATFGWQSILETSPENTLCIGIDHFGSSAPAAVLAEKYGFTPAAVAERVRERFYR